MIKSDRVKDIAELNDHDPTQVVVPGSKTAPAFFGSQKPAKNSCSGTTNASLTPQDWTIDQLPTTSPPHDSTCPQLPPLLLPLLPQPSEPVPASAKQKIRHAIRLMGEAGPLYPQSSQVSLSRGGRP